MMPRQPMPRVLSLKVCKGALENYLARDPDHLDEQTFAEKLHPLLHQAVGRRAPQKDVAAVLHAAHKAAGHLVAYAFVEGLVAHAYAKLGSAGDAAEDGTETAHTATASLATPPATPSAERDVSFCAKPGSNMTVASPEDPLTDDDVEEGRIETANAVTDSELNDPPSPKHGAAFGVQFGTKNDSVEPVDAPGSRLTIDAPTDHRTVPADNGLPRARSRSSTKRDIQTAPISTPDHFTPASHPSFDAEHDHNVEQLDEDGIRHGAVGRHSDGKLIFWSLEDLNEYVLETGEEGHVLRASGV